MQLYAPLVERFDLLAVGRRNPIHEVEGVRIPVVLLHSLAAYRAVGAVHRRLVRSRQPIADPARLLGLGRAVEGRDVLHSAETFLAVSEQAAEIRREAEPSWC